MRRLFLVTSVLVIVATFLASHANADAARARASVRLMARDIMSGGKRPRPIGTETFALVSVENPLIDPQYLSCEVSVSLVRVAVEQGQRLETPYTSRQVTIERIAPGQTATAELVLAKQATRNIDVRLGSLSCHAIAADTSAAKANAGAEAGEAGPKLVPHPSSPPRLRLAPPSDARALR